MVVRIEYITNEDNRLGRVAICTTNNHYAAYGIGIDDNEAVMCLKMQIAGDDWETVDACCQNHVRW